MLTALRRRGQAQFALVLLLAVSGANAASAPAPGLKACKLEGLAQEAWCGSIRRPLDASRPHGVTVEVGFAVLPALARQKKPDPVFFFAGGPGQSAIGLAGHLSRMFARSLNRRDLVLIDQRGTGRSVPLACKDEEPRGELASADVELQFQRLNRCREALQRLPHGDMRFFTTSHAVADMEAVRLALGLGPVNVVGASYGTRVALEYQRQFPASVRRLVLDGVAPPDMVLPASFSTDGQASLDALFRACEADTACQRSFGRLRLRWQALLGQLPRDFVVTHPLSGRVETLSVSRDMLLSWVRLPLYLPALAGGLPYAISEASEGRLGPLLALNSGMAARGRGSETLAMGQHLSVVCAEDVPRMALTKDAPGADFGDSWVRLYQRLCAAWPRGEVPPAFYTISASPVAALLLSGGADPVTPPRHGDHALHLLGPRARHVVVPQAGHGVMGLACIRDVVFRFIDAVSDEQALELDADCAKDLPRPPAFQPLMRDTKERSR